MTIQLLNILCVVNNNRIYTYIIFILDVYFYHKFDKIIPIVCKKNYYLPIARQGVYCYLINKKSEWEILIFW